MRRTRYPILRHRGDKKKFGGKIFTLVTITESKKIAEQEKKNNKEAGFNVRVIRVRGKSYVYIR